MATAAENERLAILETRVGTIDEKVSRLEGKVDTLSQAYFEDTGRRKSRSDLGVWFRASLPWLIGLVSAVITLFGLVTR